MKEILKKAKEKINIQELKTKCKELFAETYQNIVNVEIDNIDLESKKILKNKYIRESIEKIGDSKEFNENTEVLDELEKKDVLVEINKLLLEDYRTQDMLNGGSSYLKNPGDVYQYTNRDEEIFYDYYVQDDEVIVESAEDGEIYRKSYAHRIKNFYEKKEVDEKELEDESKIVEKEQDFEDEQAEKYNSAELHVTKETYDKVMKLDPEFYEGKTIAILDPSLDSKKDLHCFTEREEMLLGWREVSKWTDDSLKGKVYYEPGEYTNLKVYDIKEQEITPSKLIEVMKDSLKYTDSKTKMESILKEKSKDILAFVTGNGNPEAGFKCLLDKEKLKNNIYAYDEKKIKEFKEAFSEKNLNKAAKDYFSSQPSKNEFKGLLVDYLWEFNKVKVEQVGDNEVSTTYTVLPKESTTVNEIYEQCKESKLGDINVDRLKEKYLNLQERHESRSFWFRFIHPIENYREWKTLKQGKEFLVDIMEVPEDSLQYNANNNVVENVVDEQVEKIPVNVKSDVEKIMGEKDIEIQSQEIVIENSIDKELQK